MTKNQFAELDAHNEHQSQRQHRDRLLAGCGRLEFNPERQNHDAGRQLEPEQQTHADQRDEFLESRDPFRKSLLRAESMNTLTGRLAMSPHGRGPQGDLIRIYNCVRLVHNPLVKTLQ